MDSRRPEPASQVHAPQTGVPEAGMPVWKRFWILFTAIWLLIALMNMATVFAFGEKVDAARLLQQLAVMIFVPAALYAVGVLRDRLRKPHR